MENKKNKLFIAVIILIVAIIESVCFRLISDNGMNEIFNYFLIIINFFFVAILLLRGNFDENKKINQIIFISYVIRVIVLFLDVFGYTQGFTGNDTETFYKAVKGDISYTHNYVYYLQVISFFVGTSRIVLEYTNVILSVISLIIMKKILLLICEKDTKKVKFSLLLFGLGPANILLSASLLRESVMIFLNTLSLYCLAKWYKNKNFLRFLNACLLIIASSWFHSGVLVALLGYGLFYIIYSFEFKKISIDKNTIFSIIIAVGVLVVLYRIFASSITMYFNRVSKIEDLAVKVEMGNTDYLTFLNNTQSTSLIILCTPLKIIYFYFSPMIWDCYSVSTLLVFLFSSCLYIFLFFNILFKKSIDKSYKVALMLALLFLSITYAWGTSNAGTAMRHREKMLPILIVLFCIACKKKKGEKKHEIEHNNTSI